MLCDILWHGVGITNACLVTRLSWSSIKSIESFEHADANLDRKNVLRRIRNSLHSNVYQTPEQKTLHWLSKWLKKKFLLNKSIQKEEIDTKEQCKNQTLRNCIEPFPVWKVFDSIRPNCVIMKRSGWILNAFAQPCVKKGMKEYCLTCYSNHFYQSCFFLLYRS